MAVPTVFPYRDDGLQPFRHAPAWSTNVLGSWSTAEQRIARRQLPAGRVEFTFGAVDGPTVAAAQALLFAHASDRWLVPLWPYAVRTLAALYAGDSVVPCAAPAAGRGLEVVPWALEGSDAAPWVLVWASPTDWHLDRLVAVSTVTGWDLAWGNAWDEAEPTTPPELVLAGEVAGEGSGWGLDWDHEWGDAAAGAARFQAGALVVPLRIARLEQDSAGELDSLDAATRRLRWRLEGVPE